jgi:mannose-6-phosphate isomerase-like protein (cupin superfamily)
MLFKNLDAIPAFIAGDATLIREWLHPKNDAVNISYSIAFAELEPGAASLPHVLKTRTEVYLVLEGGGVAYVDGQAQAMQKTTWYLYPKAQNNMLKMWVIIL